MKIVDREPFFWEHQLIPVVFIANYFFSIVLRHRSCGVPFGELEKFIFLIQYEKKLIISGDLFFCWNGPV